MAKYDEKLVNLFSELEHFFINECTHGDYKHRLRCTTCEIIYLDIRNRYLGVKPKTIEINLVPVLYGICARCGVERDEQNHVIVDFQTCEQNFLCNECHEYKGYSE
jgi:hypothetical protein